MKKQRIKNFNRPELQINAKSLKLRVLVLIVAVSIFALAIGAKLFVLQVLDHEFYEALASGQHEIYEQLFPERGEIFFGEENGDEYHVVATNREYNFIYADPRHVADPEEFLNQLQAVLEFSDEEKEAMLARISNPKDPFEPIAHQITDEVAAQIEALELEGIGFSKESFRYYPEEGLGGHVLGFVGSDEAGNMSGRYGIEGRFDEEVAGEEGFIHSERNESGVWITVADRSFKPAVDGADVYLTLDRNIQYQACKQIKDAVLKHGADGGSIIVMRPTGKILGMCSYPDFNPNEYSEVPDISVFNNPAIFNQYESGSVFKAFTMAAALDQGKVTPQSTYEDTGEVQIGEHTIRNSDDKAHGTQTMTQVLEESLNTGAIFAMRQAGQEVFRDYVEAFGFGQITGMELDTEMPGNISSLWSRGEIYAATASFGQGISVTPLQLVAAFGAIANQGALVKPYIIDKIVYPDGREQVTQEKQVRQTISQRAAALLSGMLVTVVESGHGTRAAVPGYYVAGKTGTAQVPRTDGPGYDPNITIGSFAGFAPAQNPAFVMLVKIDHPRDVQWAESSAAPVFGQMAN
ncbi:penicillin-binding protein 2, partial [Patescibacteria group bacterium]|nr:penicillin-binding protein 2 [Patescibacteria group bacterium]